MKNRMKIVAVPVGVLVALRLLTGCSTTGANNKASVEMLPGESGTMGVTYVQTNGAVTITATNVGKVLLSDKARTSAKQLLSVTALKGFTYTRTNTLGGVVTSSIAAADADPDAEAIGSAGTAVGNAISNALQP